MSGVLLLGNSNRPKSPSCRTSGLPHDLHRASPHTRSAFEILQPCCVSVELTAFWMMFLEGYIGAPPTVTACSFICASVGVATAPAKASEATGASIAVRESLMSSPSVFAIRARWRYAQCTRRMQTLSNFRIYRFISLPAAITGPVGWPVGEPPGGSSDTANVASGVSRPARARRGEASTWHIRTLRQNQKLRPSADLDVAAWRKKGTSQQAPNPHV